MVLVSISYLLPFLDGNILGVVVIAVVADCVDFVADGGLVQLGSWTLRWENQQMDWKYFNLDFVD